LSGNGGLSEQAAPVNAKINSAAGERKLRLGSALAISWLRSQVTPPFYLSLRDSQGFGSK